MSSQLKHHLYEHQPNKYAQCRTSNTHNQPVTQPKLMAFIHRVSPPTQTSQSHPHVRFRRLSHRIQHVRTPTHTRSHSVITAGQRLLFRAGVRPDPLAFLDRNAGAHNTFTHTHSSHAADEHLHHRSHRTSARRARPQKPYNYDWTRAVSRLATDHPKS